MADNHYALAMYDIRGKQDYIYKSNKMKEIIGASYIIRDCFNDHLYPAAKECSQKGLFHYQSERNADFCRKRFEQHLSEGYIGEVVYDGGGNFFVLYQDAKSYREVNQRFYKRVLEGTYSLRVLTSYIEGVDFDHYADDQSKLYACHRKREQRETLMSPVNALPVVQVDYRSFLPLADQHEVAAGQKQKVSYESKRKYEKYECVMAANSKDRVVEGERILDKLVTKKGEESLLAVIYIDGNNMGAQVERCLEETDSCYEASIKALRSFSEGIQKHYIDDRIQEVDRLLKERSKHGRRFIVYAGDEITFICNARDAYDVATEYLRKLSESGGQDALRSSCAGIAVFHSHVPFADAYRIAEECCESGKKLMKEEQISHASLLDYHYCQGAIGTSLEDIRCQEETSAVSRPWFMQHEVCEKDSKGLVRGQYVTKELVSEMKAQLQNVGRSNIKTLLFSAKKSMADFRMETERIKAHQKEKDIDFSLGGKLDETQQRNLIYDMMVVYDLWFRSGE